MKALQKLALILPQATRSRKPPRRSKELQHLPLDSLCRMAVAHALGPALFYDSCAWRRQAAIRLTATPESCFQPLAAVHRKLRFLSDFHSFLCASIHPACRQPPVLWCTACSNGGRYAGAPTRRPCPCTHPGRCFWQACRWARRSSVGSQCAVSMRERRLHAGCRNKGTSRSPAGSPLCGCDTDGAEVRISTVTLPCHSDLSAGMILRFVLCKTETNRRAPVVNRWNSNLFPVDR